MEDRKIIVQKYGGSSVADVGLLKKVADHVAATARQGFRVVVVVSAMGKTTDDLIRLAQSVSPSPHRRELDMLLSTGERISMALLAMALHDRGIDAISFTGSQSGILTNDRHSGARIIEVRPVRIEDELLRDKVVIVAGFQGMSYKREITTLGRGGSDTTAVALAAALGADSCEIYSDVDGVYSADPRVVPGARHLPAISYDDMQELAEHGAKVLNAQAVQWARKAGIVIHARRTSGEVDGAPRRETLVGPVAGGGAGREHQATAVTGTQRVVLLRGRQAVIDVLAAEGVALRHLRLDGGTAEVTMVRDDLPDFARTCEKLRAACPDLSLDESLGTVTVVGAGIGSSAAAVALVGHGLHGLSPRHMDVSPLRICVWLQTRDVDPATRLLHEMLVSREG